MLSGIMFIKRDNRSHCFPVVHLQVLGEAIPGVLAKPRIMQQLKGVRQKYRFYRSHQLNHRCMICTVTYCRFARRMHAHATCNMQRRTLKQGGSQWAELKLTCAAPTPFTALWAVKTLIGR
jgi:hypothetical protein